MNGLIINFIVCAVSIFIGMWIRNQLNEGMKPLDSIKDGAISIWKFIQEKYKYCMTKIPKKDK